MKRIKLNKNFEKNIVGHDYQLDATQQYIICLENELLEQQNIMITIQNDGLPALSDYHKWLNDNGFDVNIPNPTNEFVSTYYGIKPLWSTELSQGIVVKAENDDDYYIVMECSLLNEGFKYSQIIMTIGGCI